MKTKTIRNIILGFFAIVILLAGSAFAIGYFYQCF